MNDDGKAFEREFKRKTYAEDIQSLERYIRDLSDAMTELRHESLTILKAHQLYMNDWQGQARQMYDALLDDLDDAEYRVYDSLSNVKQQATEEIERLRLKAEELI
ncbi:DUF5082 domain-containing protein [Bacillus changyiensis]|uniref:DUF5082 domain-containing protein n=1 Tax=Bacillus changyiensis TaxID=3004103 RepID=UPI0022E1E366|nr:DUF5082 domain-containing protein [Bacillus changyiensis]MDA1475823.1 DUF5082 domain-containing protein [Bacillus changyiensis]